MSAISLKLHLHANITYLQSLVMHSMSTIKIFSIYSNDYLLMTGTIIYTNGCVFRQQVHSHFSRDLELGSVRLWSQAHIEVQTSVSTIRFVKICNSSLQLHMKWSDDRKKLVRWVSVDSEFLKGWRYRDDVKLPMNWFHEHPVLGLNLVFWVIVHGVADGAFKNLTSLDDVLAVRPPAHRTSFTLEWKEQCLQQPFFRMVTSNGPDPIKGLTFSSLRHHFTSLAERDGFRDKLRVHGIRGGVANRLDPKASQAARGQALDHQNPNTFLKYQAQLKTVDIQAAFCGFQPNIEGRDMQQSMEHHRDSNVPLRLNASRRIEFEADPEVIKMNEKIRALTQEIDGKPDRHPNLCKERSTLYGQKAKLRRSHQEKLVQEWWSSSYDEYISGNDFSEKDTTSLFDIYRKYIPERDRLSRNLFENTSIDSDIGRQCLADLIAICAPTERVVYYPGLHPVDGQCPLCSQAISRYKLSSTGQTYSSMSTQVA